MTPEDFRVGTKFRSNMVALDYPNCHQEDTVINIIGEWVRGKLNDSFHKESMFAKSCELISQPEQ